MRAASASDWPPFRSISDTARISAVEIEALETARLAGTCNLPPDPPTSTLTKEEALRSARQMLESRVGAEPLAAVDAALANAGADTFGRAAVLAVLAGNPAGALAVEITRAAAGDAAAARNAAALLPFFGMGAEALALSTAATTTEPTTDAGVAGTNNRAIALNAQGVALIQMRRWAEAEVPLRQAIATDPDFTVAAANLAIAALCAGKQARTEFLLGFWRRQINIMGDFVGPSGAFVPDPSEALDLSEGRDGVLPTLYYPTEVERAQEANLRYQKLEPIAFNRQLARNARMAEIRPQLPDRYTSTLSRQRAMEIKLFAASADQYPEIAAARKVVEEMQLDGRVQTRISNFLVAAPQKIT